MFTVSTVVALELLSWNPGRRDLTVWVLSVLIMSIILKIRYINLCYNINDTQTHTHTLMLVMCYTLENRLPSSKWLLGIVNMDKKIKMCVCLYLNLQFIVFKSHSQPHSN